MDKDKRIKELEAENSALRVRVSELEGIIETLLTRIKSLEARLKSDSSTSSKPPSSDGYRKKPTPVSLRTPGKKPSGGQKGHPGYTLQQVDTPTRVISHTPETCPHCLTSLSDAKTIEVIKRQVFDLPRSVLEVIEHRAGTKACTSCGKKVRGEFPKHVKAPVQYGPRIQAQVVYLQGQHLMPEERIQSFLKDVHGVSMSSATIANYQKQLYENLSVFEEQISGEIKKAPVKHLDETGLRVAGKLHWLHCASTSTMTFYRVRKKRGDLLSGVKGIVVHDHWKPYYKMENVVHGACNAHHLRDLKALNELHDEKWAGEMFRLLILGNWLAQRYDGIIPDGLFEKFEARYDNILKEGKAYHSSLDELPANGNRGKKPHRKGCNMVSRLQIFKDDVLRFARNVLVPFTNNLAEQDIRMMKCKQKISGGFRALDGAEMFARTRSYISTLRKQGLPILGNLQEALATPGLTL